MKWGDTWLLLMLLAGTVTIGDIVAGQSPVAALGAALAAMGMFVAERD